MSEKTIHHCDICNGTDQVKRFGKWIIGHDMNMCYACFEVWYDRGQTDTGRIREMSMEAQGRHEELRSTYQI